jgi:REP element-mobilizing transposase RayT
MARPLRLKFPGAVYHLTSRGNARQTMFFSGTDRAIFLDTLSQVISRHGWICHAYCLMASHYHLFFRAGGPRSNLDFVSQALSC